MCHYLFLECVTFDESVTFECVTFTQSVKKTMAKIPHNGKSSPSSFELEIPDRKAKFESVSQMKQNCLVIFKVSQEFSCFAFSPIGKINTTRFKKRCFSKALLRTKLALKLSYLEENGCQFYY